MSISPETLIKTLLNSSEITEKEKNCLFFNNCAVVIFDGLIIWRGNLNMKYAIPNLSLLSTAIGLPVAVIEKQVLKGKKKYRTGKYCGLEKWIKASWDSDCGIDLKLMNKYGEDGHKKTRTQTNNNITTKQDTTHYYPSTTRHPGYRDWLDDHDNYGFIQ